MPTVTTAPVASVRDSAATVGKVLLPLIGRGLILRRPWVVAIAERIDADTRSVRQLQHLRDRYGPGPVALRVPGREVVVVLSPDHAREVLQSSPEPYALATTEKRPALAHFQPEGVLASTGVERTIRRRVNEMVLESDAAVHHLAPTFVRVIGDEVDDLLAHHPQSLDWDDFIVSWMRVVRRILFGDGARDDHTVTDLAGHLRAAANWAYLRPEKPQARQQLHDHIAAYIARAEEGSLAAVLAQVPDDDVAEPTQQLPQWLFAFDPAGIAAIRTLALLASHPAQAARASAELEAVDLSQPQLLPFLRACVMESVRLWPTTPAVLREMSRDTTLGGHLLAEGTTLLLHAPFFHRDHRCTGVGHPLRPRPVVGRRRRGRLAVDALQRGPGPVPWTEPGAADHQHVPRPGPARADRHPSGQDAALARQAAARHAQPLFAALRTAPALLTAMRPPSLQPDAPDRRTIGGTGDGDEGG